MATFGFDAKLERARQHIADFGTAEIAFMERDPYYAVSYEEIDTRHHVIYFRILEQCPSEILVLVGDAIHNLMSALDHLAYQLEIANHRTPGKSTYFPIYRDLDAFKNDRGQREVLFGITATERIDGLQPYKGGDEALWRLHELDIIDKHRLLIPTVGYNQSIQTSGFRSPDKLRGLELLVFLHLPRAGPLKDGAELFRGSEDIVTVTGNPVDMNMRFGFVVAFGEVWEGKMIRSGLEHMFNMVQGTLEKFRPLL
jgi:hypothetical protein